MSGKVKHLTNDKLSIIGKMRIMWKIAFLFLIAVSINGVNLVMP